MERNMSENNTENIQPQIEDKIKEALNGEALRNALDFVAFLKDIGMTPCPENPYARFRYKDYYTCIVLYPFPENGWIIGDCPVDETDGFLLEESVKEFVWENIVSCCGGCGCPEWKKEKDRTIFGKKYKSVCSCTVQFHNPDADALIKIKKLMELWIHIMDDSMKS